MPRTAPVILLTAAVALSLTACSGGDSGADSALSPIEVYLSAGDGTQLSDEERDAQGDAWLLENEELLAACMKEQGFEYIPHPPTPLGFDFSTLGSADLDDRAWIERYGYGIVFAPDREEVTITPNPNDEIVAQLSDAERSAYQVALSGAGDAYDADGDYDPEKGGCQGRAQIELDARDPLKGDQFVALQDAVMDFYQELPGQPEIVELDTAWAGCMSEAGYDEYAAQTDPLVEINSQLLLLVHDIGDDAWSDPKTETLAAREIKTALADLECRERTDYRATYAKVRTELEERFVEDHRADLEAFRTTAEQTASKS